MVRINQSSLRNTRLYIKKFEMERISHTLGKIVVKEQSRLCWMVVEHPILCILKVYRLQDHSSTLKRLIEIVLLKNFLPETEILEEILSIMISMHDNYCSYYNINYSKTVTNSVMLV